MTDYSFNEYSDPGPKKEKTITEKAEDYVNKGAAKKGGDEFKKNFIVDDVEDGYEEDVKAFDYRDWVDEEIFSPTFSHN